MAMFFQQLYSIKEDRLRAPFLVKVFINLQYFHNIKKTEARQIYFKLSGQFCWKGGEKIGASARRRRAKEFCLELLHATGRQKIIWGLCAPACKWF
jgi:hypothetical protein